jgi:HD-GYP domain-containing protein (c-di-GMP phosphodiesterase class II)
MSERSIDPAGVEMALRLRYACEAHETSIGSHLDRVSHYTCVIARLLGLPEAHIEYLRHAAPLHDVGKIGLSTELLTKPTTLTEEEMETIRSHTVIGHRILAGSGSPVMQCAARIALSHHEAWNGRGYPHGLAGAEIPLDARITAIADVYDALLSRRAYKPAWEHDAVIHELQRLRTIKFDPDILDLFLENLSAVKVA